MNEGLDYMTSLYTLWNHNNLFSLSSQVWCCEQRATSWGFVRGKEHKAALSSANDFSTQEIENRSTPSAGRINRGWMKSVFLKQQMSCSFGLSSLSRLMSASTSKTPPLWSLVTLCPRNPLSLKTKNPQRKECQTKIISMCNTSSNLIWDSDCKQKAH